MFLPGIQTDCFTVISMVRFTDWRPWCEKQWALWFWIIFSLSTESGFQNNFLTMDKTSQHWDSKVLSWMSKAEHYIFLYLCILAATILNLHAANGFLWPNRGGHKQGNAKEKARKIFQEILFLPHSWGTILPFLHGWVSWVSFSDLLAPSYVLTITLKLLPPNITGRLLSAKASGHCVSQNVLPSIQKILIFQWLQSIENPLKVFLCHSPKKVGGGVLLQSQGPGTFNLMKPPYSTFYLMKPPCSAFYLMKPPCSPSKVTADWDTESRDDSLDNDMGSGTSARWSHGSKHMQWAGKCSLASPEGRADTQVSVSNSVHGQHHLGSSYAWLSLQFSDSTDLPFLLKGSFLSKRFKGCIYSWSFCLLSGHFLGGSFSWSIT